MGRTSRLEVHPRVRGRSVEKARGLLSIDLERAAGVRASLEAHFSFATAELDPQAQEDRETVCSGSISLTCPSAVLATSTSLVRTVAQPPDLWILRVLGDFRHRRIKVVAAFRVEVMGVEQSVVVEQYHIVAVDTHTRRQAVR